MKLDSDRSFPFLIIRESLPLPDEGSWGSTFGQSADDAKNVEASHRFQ